MYDSAILVGIYILVFMYVYTYRQINIFKLIRK